MADNLEEMRDAIQDAMTYAWMISQEDANAQLDALEAVARASERERIAALVESKAWPHERPESENQFLYGLAEEIRKGSK